ncbi:MAG: hypothetical protein R3E01_22435 [Pirellulaceae bacterium]|nr:hypothetical protein [Planctomycetales bacterium]
MRQELGLSQGFVSEVQNAFSRGLLRQYLPPVYDDVVRRIRETHGRDTNELKVIADTIGAAYSTVFRWEGDLMGNSDSPSATIPSLTHFLSTVSAFNVSHSVLPESLTAVLGCYSDVLRHIRDKVKHNGGSADVPSADEIVCLHFLVRNRKLLQAILGAAKPIDDEVVDEFINLIKSVTPKTEITTVDRVKMTMKKYFVSWCILESIISHEWFEYHANP